MSAKGKTGGRAPAAGALDSFIVGIEKEGEDGALDLFTFVGLEKAKTGGRAPAAGALDNYNFVAIEKEGEDDGALDLFAFVGLEKGSFRKDDEGALDLFTFGAK